MGSRTVELPATLWQFAHDQAARQGIGTADDYVRGLVRRAQEAEAKARLEALLLEGLNSGEPIEVNDAYWADLRRELAERRHATEDASR